MKAKRNMNASIPYATRKAVYARDGYRCALCDDTRGLQIHHAVHRSLGGSDMPENLITLCWRCHSEAHGTMIPERHPNAKYYSKGKGKWIMHEMLIADYEQMIVEYLSDLYAEEGFGGWYPYK